MTNVGAITRPRIIVFGNTKGGTGKSTLAMHLAVVLLNRGLKVATVDLDGRQGTLTRYVGNRSAYESRCGNAVPLPSHKMMSPTMAPAEGEAEFTGILEELAGHDLVVIDTPGHDSSLSQFAHSHANIVITPINDSLIDLDVLAVVDPVKRRIQGPSHYAERVWKAKQEKAARDGGSIDWIVVRNRMGQLDARNKKLVGQLLGDLAKRIGFRFASGIAERVIYRELFLDGLTVEDLAVLQDQDKLAMSHVAARQELRSLVMTLGLQSMLETEQVSIGQPAKLTAGAGRDTRT
jgi:chromosome partitioning protein